MLEIEIKIIALEMGGKRARGPAPTCSNYNFFIVWIVK